MPVTLPLIDMVAEKNKKTAAAGPVAKGAELALLSCCLQDPMLVFSQCQALGVSGEWFVSYNCQMAWEAMVEIRATGMDIDVITLTQFLASEECFKDDATEFVKDVNELLETHTHWRHYFKILQAMYSQRLAIRYANELNESLENPIKTVDELTERMQGPLTRLSRISLSEEGRRLKQVANEFVEATERQIKGVILEEDTARVIVFPIDGANEKLYPFNPDRRDNLVIIGGRPGQGKTALAVQTVLKNLENGKICVCFWLETEIEDALSQMASQKAGIDLLRVQDGWDEIKKEAGGHAKIALYFETLKWLRDRCEDTLWMFSDIFDLQSIEARWNEVLAKTGRIDLGVIDHCHLVEFKSDVPMNKVEKLEEISRRAKLMPKAARCVMLLLCQLNRVGAEGPTLETLRGSGSLEQDADRVIFVWRPYLDSNGNEQKDRKVYEQRIIQAKMKNGPRRYIKVGFEAAHTHFKDLAQFVDGDAKRGRPRKDQEHNLGEEF